jgi:hypothetical protein
VDKIYKERDPWLVYSVSQRFSKELKVIIHQKVKEKEMHGMRKLIEFLVHQYRYFRAQIIVEKKKDQIKVKKIKVKVKAGASTN